jgi:small subunit ribosomal protein S18
MRQGPRGDKDAMGEGGPRFKGKRRRKVSYLTLNKIDTVDYKEVNILRRFLNDRGKIIPSRQSGNTAKQQRMIASAIRKAREMALLPFVVNEMGTDRREYGPRRERSYDRPYTPRGDRGDRGERPERPQAEAPAAETAAPETAAAEVTTEASE